MFSYPNVLLKLKNCCLFIVLEKFLLFELLLFEIDLGSCPSFPSVRQMVSLVRGSRLRR
jgi:hypothetical protein